MKFRIEVIDRNKAPGMFGVSAPNPVRNFDTEDDGEAHSLESLLAYLMAPGIEVRLHLADDPTPRVGDVVEMLIATPEGPITSAGTPSRKRRPAGAKYYVREDPRMMPGSYMSVKVATHRWDHSKPGYVSDLGWDNYDEFNANVANIRVISRPVTSDLLI